MPVLSITIEKRVIARIQREARRAFPIECFVALLGKMRGPSAEVSDIWIPNDLSSYSTENGFTEMPHRWTVEANEKALEIGLEVIGHFHSHPYKFKDQKRPFAPKEYLAPSYGDWNMEWSNIMGIMCVIENAEGNLRTRYKLYGPTVSVRAKVA